MSLSVCLHPFLLITKSIKKPTDYTPAKQSEDLAFTGVIILHILQEFFACLQNGYGPTHYRVIRKETIVAP